MKVWHLLSRSTELKTTLAFHLPKQDLPELLLIYANPELPVQTVHNQYKTCFEITLQDKMHLMIEIQTQNGFSIFLLIPLVHIYTVLLLQPLSATFFVSHEVLRCSTILLCIITEKVYLCICLHVSVGAMERVNHSFFTCPILFTQSQ